MTDQERFMKEAIRQAKKARALEEVPIGCDRIRRKDHSQRLQPPQYRQKYIIPCRTQCYPKSQQETGRLAT